MCVCVGFTTEKHGEIWGMMESFYILCGVMVTQLTIYVCQILQKMSIKRVIFNVFKLFLYFFMERKVSKIDGLNP